MHTVHITKKSVYKAILWILLIISTLLLIHLSPILFKPEVLPSDDFFHYWASGNLNIQGKNHFDPLIIEQLKIQAGSLPSNSNMTAITLNPPWAISILMPFGMLSFRVSRFVWLIFSIALLLLSSQLLWRIYSGNPKQRWLAILTVFIFAPTISVLEVGQIAAFILIGIVGFLYFTVIVRNDWMAGISLAVIAIKPQLVILFWIALLFWVIQQRRWLIPISTMITIIGLTLIAMVTNPHIIQQYLGMLQTYQITDWASPTIGAYIRYFWLGLDKFWIQFIPSLAAGLWMIFYWYRHRTTWKWINELPIILLVSQLTSPYSWTYDLVILLPAILLAAIWVTGNWKRWMTLFLAIIFLCINILDLVLHMKLDDFWFIWVVPALFIWFLLIRWQYPKLIESR